MNRKRRKTLEESVELLRRAQAKLEAVIDEEQYALDNTPENMVDGERYSEREENLDELNDILSNLEEVVEKLSEKT